MSKPAVTPFVLDQFRPQLPPPRAMSGPLAWIYQNFLSGPFNIIVTLMMAFVLFNSIPPLIDWLFINATWSGETGQDCIPADGTSYGACWTFIKVRFDQFIYGRYPIEERWRVNLTGLFFFAGLIMAAVPSLPFKRETALTMLVIFPVVAFFLLYGGIGLTVVETSLWGGLLVTLVVAVTGIVASLPLGILLALGRRSKLPIIKYTSVVFIEFWRGVPLITVLFMSSVMLPYFLPAGTSFDKLLRALIGVAIFSAAYMAETIRGGLQAIPKGQFEAAAAMGLGYWQAMRLIILPQALKIVIPGIVNSFISLFKDTSLVLTIGIYDLLGIVQQSFSSDNWLVKNVPATGLVFAGVIFWVFCFSMSRYSQFMERRLNTGHKR